MAELAAQWKGADAAVRLLSLSRVARAIRVLSSTSS